MGRLRKYKVDLIVVAGFALLPLLLFWGVSVGDRTMLPVDNLFQWQPWASAASDFGVEIPQNSLITDLIIENYAWKRFILNNVQEGEIPLWNPYLFAGAPFLATGQHSAYYPFSVLFLVLPLAKAYGWFVVSQLWLAGVLMYVFGRSLTLRRGSAAVAGLVYQGAGFMVVSAAVFPMILAAAVWLPLLLACIESVVDRSSTTSNQRGPALPWVVLGAIGLGVQILAGHIEITYYTLLIMAAFTLWRLASSLRQQRSIAAALTPAAWLLSMVALGVMLGAIQLIPFYEVGQLNFRQDAVSFAEVRSWAFPLRRIVTLAVPNFYGNPAHHHYIDLISGTVTPFVNNYYGELNPRGHFSSDWGIKNYVEGGIYLGVLPLLLAGIGVIGAWRRPSREEQRSHVGFLASLSLLSLAFIFGTPLYAILYYGLPFVNQLHTPFRWVFPLSLCVAALSGCGAEHLARASPRLGYRGRQSHQQSLIPKDGARMTWASDKGGSSLMRPLMLSGKPSLITLLGGLSFYGGLLLLATLLTSRLFYGELEPAIERLFLALSHAADAFPTARAFYSYEFQQLFLLALMLVAAGTVLRVSQCPIFVRGRPVWWFLAALVIVLDLFASNFGFNAKVDPELLDYEPELVRWLEQQPGIWRLTSFNPRGDKPLNANAGWLYDLQDVRGYDSIIPRQYTAYMTAIEPQNELPFNRVQPIANQESLNSPLLDVLGVRYIITAESIDLPKLQLAWEGEGLRVYENLAVAPRAMTLPQTSTALVDDALSALARLDPRQYVVVEKRELPFGQADAPLDSQSSIPSSYQPAHVDEYRDVQVTVTANVLDPSWLILNDSYFPGWKAFIRPAGSGRDAEREVRITRVNGNFRGVSLEPGEWTVHFRYSPRSFQLGALTSFMGGIILLFAVGVWGWRRAVGPDAKLTTTRSIAKNSIVPVMMNLLNRLIDFAFAAFYLRVLGPADAGSYATAIATAGVFEIISNYGLDILLMREVSQDRSKAAHYLLNTSVFRLGAAVVASLPIALLVLGTGFLDNPPSSAEIAAIALIMVGMVFSGLSKGVDRLFYVYERAEVPAAMTTVTTFLKVFFGVGALLFGFGFVGLAAVSILTNVITLMILAFLAGRHIGLSGPWRVDWPLQRQMIRLGFPLMLIHLLQTVFISVDVFLLRFMMSNGEEVVGWYNSAYKWFNALQIVPSFFTLALFPVISRAIKNAPESAQRMYRLSLKLMLLLALPVAAVTSLTAFPLVRILAGDEFLPHGARALQIVIWSIPIGWLNSVTNYVLIGLGLEKRQPWAFAIAVGFNIVSNIILIPRFTYIAASITTILSELVLLLLFNYYLRRRMPAMNWFRFVWRPVAATAVMVLAMWVGRQVHMGIGLLAGVVVYSLGLWFLRVVGREERQILRSILPTSIADRMRAS